MSDYQFSYAVSAAELKKWGVSTTIEVRKHKQEELAHQGSREFIQDISEAWDYNVTWKGCSQKDGHLMALSVPECLPDRLGLLSAICDMSLLQDDIFENTTDAQREKGALDEFGDFQSVLAQKGLPTNALAMFPQAKKKFMKNVLAKDPGLASWMPQEVDRVATAPPRDRMNYDTLDSYMDERLRDVSMKWFYVLCAYGMDLKLNEKEKEQSCLPTLAMEKAIIYANDIYSWAKEKAEQETVAASKDMFSAVAVLMKEHKISETKALDLLREKIIECEKDHFAAVADLETAGPVSATLYQYFDMTRLCHSGGMLWSALCDRYNKVGLPQVKGDANTKEQIPSAPSEMKTAPSKNSSSAMSDGGHPKSEHKAHINGGSVRDDGLFRLNGSNIDGDADHFSQRNGLSGLHKNDIASEESIKDVALAPYEYVKSMPCKKIREVLIDGLNIWFQLPQKLLDNIRNIVVMLHTSALMLDDIEDGSKLRRGQPSAHLVYGESQTINSASYVQTCAYAEAAKLPSRCSVSAFCEEIENLYKGQSLDLFWKFHNHCPSEKEYMEMVDGKTGGLFRLILRLMQVECPFSKNYEPELEFFIKTLGRYFQIRDDYQNLASSDYAEQKGYCEDLDEGKMSLPLIHSLQHSSDAEKARIMGIFKTRGPRGLLPEAKALVMKHLSEKTGSLAYVRCMLKALEVELADALVALEKISGVTNPLIGNLLVKLEL